MDTDSFWKQTFFGWLTYLWILTAVWHQYFEGSWLKRLSNSHNINNNLTTPKTLLQTKQHFIWLFFCINWTHYLWVKQTLLFLVSLITNYSWFTNPGANRPTQLEWNIHCLLRADDDCIVVFKRDVMLKLFKDQNNSSPLDELLTSVSCMWIEFTSVRIRAHSAALRSTKRDANSSFQQLEIKQEQTAQSCRSCIWSEQFSL